MPGFSADHSHSQSSTKLPGSNILVGILADPVQREIEAVQYAKADTDDNKPKSHIDPATGFVQSDVVTNSTRAGEVEHT